MVAFKQYPHYLYKVVQPTAYQDAHGNWVQSGEAGETFMGMCRYEIDGKGTQYDTTDGRHIVISGIVYMGPTDCTILNNDTLVVYRDSDKENMLCRKAVVNIDHGRLHTRIWLQS